MKYDKNDTSVSEIWHGYHFIGGQKMSTTEELIKKSGVSRSTVFRFLRGENVRPEIKKAILQAMDELGYQHANRLKLDGMVFEISVMKDFERFRGFTEVIQGITERAEEKGIKIQLAVRNSAQIDKEYERWNENHPVKGIIIIGKDRDNETKEGEMLQQKGIPHIFVNRMINEPEASYVSVDVKKGAFELVDYFIKKGHKKIATLGYPDVLRIDKDKLDGYADAFAENGMEVQKQYVFQLKQGESSGDAIDAILGMEDRPTAFFGICDSYAMEFINKARAMGYGVPKDIAVAGMDDLEIARYYKPALTTVKTPFRKLGALAVDNLLQLITENLGSIKTIVRHHLFIRESS